MHKIIQILIGWDSVEDVPTDLTTSANFTPHGNMLSANSANRVGRHQRATYKFFNPIYIIYYRIF